MIKKLSLCLLGAFALSGCVTMPKSTPPAATISAATPISVSAALPAEDDRPGAAKPIGNTEFMVVQTRGGSILLGPIFGAINIAANSRKMAESSQGQITTFALADLTKTTLQTQGLVVSDAGALQIRPYVIVQQCVDDLFRLTLSYSVRDTSTGWSSRYSYHLPTPIAQDQLAHADAKIYEQFQKELTVGAGRITQLIKMDLNHQLPAEGRKASLGSIYLLGDKFGGMGIYTLPKDAFFNNAKIIEDTDDHVIARMEGTMGAAPFMGGLIFGVHYFEKPLIHKLSYM